MWAWNPFLIYTWALLHSLSSSPSIFVSGAFINSFSLPAMKLSPQIPLYSSLVLPSIAAAAPAPGSQNCPFNGPSFRPALDPLSTSAIQNAREKFPTILANALASGLLDNQTTSFSISVFAATGESGNQTLFTEHFLAPGHRDDGTVWSGRNESVKMGDESLYRIGSISKLVSLYALLVERGWQVLDKGIGEFVPELLESEDEDEEDLGELDRVRWEEVTVGDLAGHLAGLARDCERKSCSPEILLCVGGRI